MSKLCSFCNKKIILVPSATERAQRYGGKPSDYTDLFTSHSQCLVEHRNSEVKALMDRISRQGK